jgi:hypothetical protein
MRRLWSMQRQRQQAAALEDAKRAAEARFFELLQDFVAVRAAPGAWLLPTGQHVLPWVPPTCMPPPPADQRRPARMHATDPLRRVCTHFSAPPDPRRRRRQCVTRAALNRGQRRSHRTGQEPPVATTERISKAPATHTNVRERMARRLRRRRQ